MLSNLQCPLWPLEKLEHDDWMMELFAPGDEQHPIEGRALWLDF
jgi:hypothetical protein